VALRVTRPRTHWWHTFARRVQRSPEAVGDIVRAAGATHGRFPHVRVRMVNGRAEAFIPDTGLSIWEVAWIARAYDGDVDATVRHTEAPRDLIEEGLRYAAEHRAETDAQIALHTDYTLEDLLQMYPGIQVFTFDPSEPDGQLD